MDQLDTVLEREVAVAAAVADMKLEVVVIPVSGVDRAKRFYGKLGWRLDADFVVGDDFRVVQFTPPGSPSSIHFGIGVTSAVPGSARGLYLVVSDIQAARAELVDRGVDVHRQDPARKTRNNVLVEPSPQHRSLVCVAALSAEDAKLQLVDRQHRKVKSGSVHASCPSHDTCVRLATRRLPQFRDDVCVEQEHLTSQLVLR